MQGFGIQLINPNIIIRHPYYFVNSLFCLEEKEENVVVVIVEKLGSINSNRIRSGSNSSSRSSNRSNSSSNWVFNIIKSISYDRLFLVLSALILSVCTRMLSNEMIFEY